MSYQDRFKQKAPKLYPMYNTGTILDISAGNYELGVHGQMILNGGVAPFAGIGALPNMYKTTLLALWIGSVLRAQPPRNGEGGAIAQAHDTETTMQQDRMEQLARYSAYLYGRGDLNQDLRKDGRLFFTTSVDYDGTELFDQMKAFGKERTNNRGAMIETEFVDELNGNKPYKYHDIVAVAMDSLSGLKTKDATEKQEDADVGTKETNMLAMNFNKGKSDIVEQAPNLTAKSGIYMMFTAHVGQKYDLDPRKPGVRTLRWMKGEVKLKRVPENTTFNTGNFYIIANMTPLRQGDGSDEFPWDTDEKSMRTNDLIELTVANQRGKFGPSDVPHKIAVSQRFGANPPLSNYLYLRDAKYGITKSGTSNFSVDLYPEVSMTRVNFNLKCRENYRLQHALKISMELHWMGTRQRDKYEELLCTPAELRQDLLDMGYDWELLLNARWWHQNLVPKTKEEIPYISTLDLLRIRKGLYHPYWYPVKQKDLESKVKPNEKESS